MFPNQVVVESWIPLQAGSILFAALMTFVIHKTKRVHATNKIIKHQKLYTQCKLLPRLPRVLFAGLIPPVPSRFETGSACLPAMLSRFFVRHYFGGTFGRERLVRRRRRRRLFNQKHCV
jgi:hypothetical protein